MSNFKYTMQEELVIIGSFIVLIAVLLIPSLGCDVSNYCTINQADNITVKVYNMTSGELLTDANCTISIYRGNINITQGISMTNNDDGLYYHTLSGTEIDTSGVYDYYLNVSKETYHSFISGRYEIVNNLPIDISIDSNNTIHKIEANITTSDSELYDNIWSYTTRTLTQVVDVNYATIAAYVWNYTTRNIASVTSAPIVYTNPDGSQEVVQTENLRQPSVTDKLQGTKGVTKSGSSMWEKFWGK